MTGWRLNGEMISTEGDLEFTMPDHDITLERVFVYDPTLPANPGANTGYNMEDGMTELVIDDFLPGSLSTAIASTQLLQNFIFGNVTSLVVKERVNPVDFSPITQLSNLQKVDFRRTNLAMSIPRAGGAVTSLQLCCLHAWRVLAVMLLRTVST